MQFYAVLNSGDKNYKIQFQDQAPPGESTFNIEGHSIKITLSSIEGKTAELEIAKKMKQLRSHPSLTLKRIYAVLLGVHENAVVVDELYASFDTIQKVAREKILTSREKGWDTTKNPIQIPVFEAEIENKVEEAARIHDEALTELRELQERKWSQLEFTEKTLEMAKNVLSLGTIPILTALHQRSLENKLRQSTIEIIENLLKLHQLKVITTQEETEAARPHLDFMLEQALWIDHIGYINELIKAGAKLKLEDFTIAVALQSRRLMDLLYNAGLNINDFQIRLNRTLLHLACTNIDKPVDAIRFMLDYGADPEARDEEGVTPMHLALENNLPVEILRELLKKVKNLNLVDNNGRSLLVSAIVGQKSRDPSMLKFLLEKGVDPNTKDKNGQTPVCAAILHLRSDSMPAVKELIKAGAVVTTKDNREATPLHYAALTSGIGMEGIDDGALAHLLIQYGASPKATTAGGLTPLHSACRRGVSPSNERTLLELLRAGANVDAVDNEGNTALHYASMLGHIDQVRFLLSNGAGRHIRNKYGETAAAKANFAGLFWVEASRQILDLLGKVQG